MKVLNHVKIVMLRIWRSQLFKYSVICVLGIVVVGFLGENSIWSHVKNERRINELQEETEKYQAAFRRDQAQIHELERNPKAIEKIARERYFMKADDEDIFVLSDDERAPKPIVIDEAAD